MAAGHAHMTENPTALHIGLHPFDQELPKDAGSFAIVRFINSLWPISTLADGPGHLRPLP
jgi:hypothetical protein